jgi:hypothetical protein
VTVCSVLVWIAETPAEPLTGRATVTAMIGRSVVPKALEIRILILSPPMDVCIVWRIVEFTKTEPLLFCYDDQLCRLRETVNLHMEQEGDLQTQ